MRQGQETLRRPWGAAVAACRAGVGRCRPVPERSWPLDGGADDRLRRWGAWARLALLVPLGVAGLVVGLGRMRQPYLVLLVCFVLWSLFQVYLAHREPRPDGRREPVVVVVDLVLLAGLAGVSGGSGSPVRLAYFLLPLATVLWQRPRRTVIVGLLCVLVYALLLLVHPVPLTGVLALHVVMHGTYLLWLVAVSAMLAAVLRRRARRVGELLAAREALLDDALAAEERQRAELADLLHDGPVQTLLAACQDLEEVCAGERTEAVARAERGIRDTVADLRGAVLDLHPQVLVAVGLGAAIRQAGQRAAERGGFAVTYDLPVEGHVPQEHLLYSAVREALANVVRHSGAGQVWLSLCYEGADTVVTVRDNGRGFDTGILCSRVADGHIGLASHRVRLETAGGSLVVDSRLGRGTTVGIRAPRAPLGAQHGERVRRLRVQCGGHDDRP